jgi:hypothetical protein
MGGIVSRRYLLNKKAKGKDSYVDKLITIGTPWLGVPKTIWTVETGNFMDNFLDLILKKDNRALSLISPSVHQLLPSSTYFSIANNTSLKSPFAKIDRDPITFTLLPKQALSFGLYYGWLNRFPATPMERNVTFHTNMGNNIWDDDQTGVAYTHFVGKQAINHTVVQVTAIQNLDCPNVPGQSRCKVAGSYDYSPDPRGLGDGSVTMISGMRGKKANAAEFKIVPLGPDSSTGLEFNHTSLTKLVAKDVEAIIDPHPSQAQRLQPGIASSEELTTTQLDTQPPHFNLHLTGMEDITIEKESQFVGVDVLKGENVFDIDTTEINKNWLVKFKIKNSQDIFQRVVNITFIKRDGYTCNYTDLDDLEECTSLNNRVVVMKEKS